MNRVFTAPRGIANTFGLVARIGIILNPNSGKNRKAAPGRAERLQAIVGRHGVVVQTRSLLELRPALAALLDEGVQCLVSDGGDGALHWMLNEGRRLIAEDPRFADAVLPPALPTNGGTIDFVAKKAGLKGGAEQLVAGLVDAMADGAPPPEISVDSLEITGTEWAEGTMQSFRRMGFALAAGGASVQAFEAADDHVAALAAAAGHAGLGGKVTAEPRDLVRRPLSADELEGFDGAVLDPPRPGAEAQVRQLAQAGVPRLAYVSCNPVSFARDARLLVEGGYTLESVMPLDQFLFTPHVELAALFRRGG